MGTHFCKCIVAGLLLCLMGSAAARAQQKPNILFIAVDDLRCETGCYGSKIVISPNIDRLAARGLVFDRAYCQQAVCSPSRSSLLTGTRPDTTKVWDLKTHFRTALPDVITLPQHFKNNGYFVQGMGKIYHGGYDDPPSWSVPWQNSHKGIKQYALEENRQLVAKKRKAAQDAGKTGDALYHASYGPAFESADVPDETFADGVVAEMAIKALSEAKARGGPFFLAVGFARPHLPFVAPQKYWDLYDPAKIELAGNPFKPKDAPPYAIQPPGELREYDNIPKVPKLSEDLARTLKHGYYASISYMDAQLGRVLNELEKQGFADNTIIILWGDHGWKLGEHNGWGKATNVENDTNAPLILSAPGMKSAGKHCNALVEFVDVYPTLAEMAGLKLPAQLEGVSFKPLLEDPSRAWKSAAFSQYPRNPAGRKLMGYTMRTDRYRFTRWVNRDDPTKIEAEELYDHSSDPQENQNIAGVAENKAVLDELRRQMNAGWKGSLPK